MAYAYYRTGTIVSGKIGFFCRRSGLSRSIAICLLGLIVFAIYLPALLNDFGFHNDYLMLDLLDSSLLGFIEAKDLFMIGRPLGAILLTVQCWFVSTIAGFAGIRLVSMVGMFTLAALFYRHLRRRYSVDPFWSAIVAVGILISPSTQLFVLWGTNFVPGTLTLLLTFLSYRLLDDTDLSLRSTQDVLHSDTHDHRQVVIRLLRAFFVHLLALLIYPANAMLVFTLSFVNLFFAVPDRRSYRFRAVLRDLIFFCSTMIAYRIIDRLVLAGVAETFAGFAPPPNAYLTMDIAFNPLLKIPLFVDTLLVALAGPFQLIDRSTIPALLIAVSFGMIALHGLFRAIRTLPTNSTTRKTVLYDRALTFCLTLLLFSLCNLPSLIAGENFRMVGFRTMFPATILVLILQVGLLRGALSCKTCQNLARWAAVGLITVFLLIAGSHVDRTVKQYQHELASFRGAVAQADYEHLNSFVIRFRPAYIGELPFEFSYMITAEQHVRPILREQLHKAGRSMYPYFCLDHSQPIGRFRHDARFALVDLND